MFQKDMLNRFPGMHALIVKIINENMKTNLTSKGRTISRVELEATEAELFAELHDFWNRIQEDRARGYLQARLNSDQLWRELQTVQTRSRELLAIMRTDSRQSLLDEKRRLREACDLIEQRILSFKRNINQESTAGIYSGLVRIRTEIIFSISGIFFASTAAFFGYLRYIAA